MIKGFIHFELKIHQLLEQIIQNPVLHGLWINTLSYLENCGARKIASCEHPFEVKEEMLKHASEEFRHAYFLKRQLKRIDQHYEDYHSSHLLGRMTGYHYLNALDLKTSRYLSSIDTGKAKIKQISYLLVTYAIELRAQELYPIYQNLLKKHSSKIQVQSILLEEKEHLQAMEQELNLMPEALLHAEKILKIEAELFEKWIEACFFHVGKSNVKSLSVIVGNP